MPCSIHIPPLTSQKEQGHAPNAAGAGTQGVTPAGSTPGRAPRQEPGSAPGFGRTGGRRKRSTQPRGSRLTASGHGGRRRGPELPRREAEELRRERRARRGSCRAAGAGPGGEARRGEAGGRAGPELQGRHLAPPAPPQVSARGRRRGRDPEGGQRAGDAEPLPSTAILPASHSVPAADTALPRPPPRPRAGSAHLRPPRSTCGSR